MKRLEPLRLMIAGGGTGGHLFPAIAIAEEVQRQGGEVLFVGTARGLESRILPEMGHRLATLKVGQLKGGGVGRRLRTLMGLPKAWWQARGLVKAFCPHAVLGMGGYASAPAVAAAWSLGVPTALHEQNALPGLTNRYLGRLADRVFLSFPQAEGSFAEGKRQLVGNPVRRSFFSAGSANDPQAVTADAPFRILIFGGSQGAQIFSEKLPPALARLREDGVKLSIHHQAPKGDVEALQARYEELDLKARVVPFIEEMADAYRVADLVICRAGATTVAELAAVGRGALLVPYPYAADDHQAANAQALEALGGGWMRRQEALEDAWLYRFLRERAADREGLKQVGEKARGVAIPGSAGGVVEALRALA